MSVPEKQGPRAHGNQRVVLIIATMAVSVFAVFFLGRGREVTMICAGRAQLVSQPESRTEIDAVAVRVTKYPRYFGLGSRSYGSLKVSHPHADYFSTLEELGDLILIRGPNLETLGMFNTISGHLTLASHGQLFDVSCKASKPVI